MPLSKEEKAALILRYHPAYQKNASLLNLCFPKQRKAFTNNSLLNAILCTRRAGKSYGCGLKMVETGKEHEGCIIPYVTLTADSGKNIIAPVLREIKTLYQAPIEERKDGKEWIVNPESTRPSKIIVHGADQKNFIERLRGPKYPIVMIDEAASFKRNLMEYLVDEVFPPAVGDYNGQIYLIGTPGPIPEGYFYDATQGKNGFETFFWRVQDNPYFPDPDAFIKALLQKKNWTRDTPKFRREWLGEWVLDSDALVYRLNESRNLIETLPQQFDEWRYVIGVDVGWHDKTAFAVLCYSPGSSNVYVFQTLSFQNMIPYDAAQELLRLTEHFEPDSIVMDTGGLGKSIAEEFSRRYDLPIKAAEKTDKMGHIEMLNNDLQTGKMKIIREHNQEVLHQMKILQKLDNGKEDPSVPNDVVDAVLYAWRECYHYTFNPSEPHLDRNSDAFMDREWKKLAQKITERHRQETLTEDLMMEGMEEWT